ncbi:calcium-binding protein [uncultured Sphingomonas sp.]|uniref:calcium-binding protein n=1 Tax=uncultured Sphingomonas sp. TaxID=158754 RepID=UPI0035CA1EB9
MPNVWQIRGGQSFNFNFNAGVVRASYNVGVNPVGAGSVGPSVSVGVGPWEGRAGFDANGNWNIIGGAGWEAPSWATRGFGTAKVFTGVGYSSQFGGVDVTDIELRFKNIGPGGMFSGARYQNQTPLGDIFGPFRPQRDPLVIDLDNDGITLTALRYSTASFDFGGDGARERVGWVGPTDGIIVSDMDGDGVISSLADLFGDGAGDAFATLTAHDLNQDGKLSASDSLFASLRVWRDSNSDGIAQAAELAVLSDVGIQHINLSNQAVNQNVDGNVIVNSGTVTLTNGAVRNAYSLAFATDQSSNAGIPAGVALPDELLAMANLRGFGAVRELWDWALSDPGHLSKLQAAVADFKDAETISELVGSWSWSFVTAGYSTPVYNMSKFEKFIAEWAGVSGDTDDQKIKAIAEKFAGVSLAGAVAGNTTFYEVFMEFSANLAVRFIRQAVVGELQSAGMSLIQAITELDAGALSSMTQQEMEQLVSSFVPANLINPASSTLADSLAGVHYSFASDKFSDGLADVLASRLDLDASASPADSWKAARGLRSDDPWLISLAEKANPDPTKGTALELAVRIASHNTALPVHGADHDKIVGTTGDDILGSTGRLTPNLIISDGGSDTITGGIENTTIQFKTVSGHSTVADTGGVDEIAFSSLVSEDITYQWSSSANRLTIVATNGSITIENAFELNGVPRIERVSFADGAVFSAVELRSAALSALTTDSGDAIRGWDKSQILSGGAGDDQLTGGVERDFISGGDGADTIAPGAGDDIVAGDAGDDTILESEGNDTYLWIPADGSETVTGGGRWDGYNIIELSDGFVASDLKFVQVGQSGADLKIEVPGYPGSFIIENAFNSWGDEKIDEIKFSDGSFLTRSQFIARALQTASTSENDSVFGSRLNDVISVGAGNDVIDARHGDDRVIGGAGDDTIWETDGNDTYVWNLGDGHDVLRNGGGWDGYNVLEFGVGISATNLRFAQVGEASRDLRITVAGQVGSFTVEKAFDRDGDEQVDVIRFADGSTLTREQVFVSAVASSATDGADNIRGSRFNDIIEAGAGDDWIHARSGNDVLIGGIGTDTLGGGSGDDTYRFARGDGQDTIRDGIDYWDGGNGGNDTIELGVGITPGQVTVSQQANNRDLKLDLGQGDSIVIGNSPLTDDGNKIERVVFADGTVWTAADLFARSTIPTDGVDRFAGTHGEEMIAGGASGDWIHARGGNDVLIGGTGADTLGGGSGDDTYRFSRGDGQDTIRDGIDYWDGGNGGNDTIELGMGIDPDVVKVTQHSNGHDLLLDLGQGDSILIGNSPLTDAGNRIEQVRFANGVVWTAADLFARSTIPTEGADRFAGTHGEETIAGGAGDDWIHARSGNDLLIGGTGADTLGGGAGDDVYRFNRGDGQDTIRDGIDYWDGGNGGTDTIELGVGITADQVTVSQQNGGRDLLLDLGQGDSISIGNSPLTDDGNKIEQVKFADGTVWTAADLLQRSSGATAGADRLYGTHGDNLMAGGAGDDWIHARSGNDVLVGGVGNDTLGGGAGDDIYRFERGNGQDTIFDGIDYWDGGNGGNDTIELGVGITADQVTISQQNNGRDLKLDLGQGDSILIGYSPLTDGGNRIEQVKFADGTMWTAADLFARSTIPTGGADRFAGTHGEETIAGGAGNDWIHARNGNDVLVGGTGDDTLGGGSGDDVYRFARGDGQDTIQDGIDYWDGGNGGNDRVELGVGITPDQVKVSQQNGGRDLKLDLGQGDSILIGYSPLTDGGNAIEQVVFADGTIWSAADLFARSVAPTDGADRFAGTHGGETIAGGAGDDWIHARSGNDVLIGGTGNDTLGGGSGDDTYRFARGDGQDTIQDGIDYWDGGNGGNDTIELGVGITPDQVKISQQNSGRDLKLDLGGSDSILIGYSPLTDGGNRIEQVKFADGTVWSAADLFARSVIPTDGADRFAGTHGDETIAGGAGADWIHARNGNDTLIGGTGNDTLGGGSGDDTYRFERGDGQDTIRDGIDYWDGGNGGNDRIALGAGITPVQVTVTQQNGGRDLLIDFGQGDSVYIGNSPLTDGGNTIERVTFADGTVWTAADLFARSIAPTSGADRFAGTHGGETISGGAGDDWIHARNGNDVLVGGTGNDTLGGGSGDDTYRFARGDGQDTILDGIDYWDGGNGGNDTIELGAGITSDQVVVTARNNGRDLKLDLAQGDSIYIGNAPLVDGGNTIERLVFADGTIWTAAFIAARAAEDPATRSSAGADSGYRYSSGDGAHSIYDAGSASDVDTLMFTDLVASQVGLLRDDDDLFVRDLTTSQESRVDYQFYSNASYGIEQIAVADGVAWNRSAFLHNVADWPMV